jgi:hypothetical protein
VQKDIRRTAQIAVNLIRRTRYQPNIKLVGPGFTMRHFNAEDETVYEAWLRRTAFAYGALVLLAGATITTLAVTHAPTASSYLVAAINLAAP